jgi:hypothetical protein
MATFQSITDTAEYQEALRKIQNDVPKFLGVSGRNRATVRFPRTLTDVISKRGKTSYEVVQKKMATSMSQFGNIASWNRGEDKSGEYIEFVLIGKES